MTDTLYGIWGSTLTGIANAIRTKNPDVTGLVDPVDMEQDILDISGGGGEPYIPKEELVSKYDFTSNTPYYDEAREMSINTPSGFTHSTESGITISQTSAYMPTYFALSRGKYYRIELEVGDYTLATSGIETASAMLNFSTSNPINEQASICWKKDSQRWAVYTGSGWKYASADYGINYFKNKKIIILYNCKYVNGQLVKYTDYPNYDYKYFNFYDEDYNLLIEDYESSAGTASTVGLGGINSYACKGSVFKSLKIYELNLDIDPSQDIILPLSITENGTYNADGVTVAGYSPITVDVHKMLYKWDFTKSSNPLVDEVCGKAGNLSGQLAIGANGYSTDGFTRFDPLLLNNNLILDGFKTRFKVKFGEFFSTSHSSGEKGRTFSFGTSVSLYWNDVPMLYGPGVGGVYRLTALDNQFDLLEDDELIVDFYKDGNNYKANWIFPDGTEINYGTIDLNSYIILGEYQYTDNGLGGVYVKGLEIELIPIPIV